MNDADDQKLKNNYYLLTVTLFYVYTYFKTF